MTTQKVYVSYEEILDLKTSQHHVTVVGVHTPTGDTPHKLFPGFWRQYQKVKYIGASLSLVPAARLPADISQVGFEGGEQPIDMRDLLNPILWHGCHGNSMGAVLNQFMNGGSGPNDMVSRLFDTPTVDVYGTQGFTSRNHIYGDVFEDMYYKALTDNTWAKAHPQKGFRKAGLRPLVYELAINQQIGNVESNVGHGPYTVNFNDDETIYDNPLKSSYGSSSMGISNPSSGYSPYQSAALRISGAMDGIHLTSQGEYDDAAANYTAKGIQFVTNRLRGLGWLDTYSRFGNSTVTQLTDMEFAGTVYGSMDDASVTTIPYLMMGLILLPPSYIAEQFFRLVIRHKFAFCKYRGFSFTNQTNFDSNRTTFNGVPAIDSWAHGNNKGDDRGTDDGKENGSERLGEDSPVL